MHTPNAATYPAKNTERLAPPTVVITNQQSPPLQDGAIIDKSVYPRPPQRGQPAQQLHILPTANTTRKQEPKNPKITHGRQGTPLQTPQVPIGQILPTGHIRANPTPKITSSPQPIQPNLKPNEEPQRAVHGPPPMFKAHILNHRRIPKPQHNHRGHTTQTRYFKFRNIIHALNIYAPQRPWIRFFGILCNERNNGGENKVRALA